ncbi:hypothetical protein BH09VER1_BH09VER1_52740 [soil metagenome]
MSLSSALTQKVGGESWKDLVLVVFSVWLTIWILAALHDQYLIRIAPEHFTVWHPKIAETQNLTILAVLYAFWASLSPGIFLGLTLYLAARVFDRPKRSLRQIVLSVAVVWALVEICALSLGAVAWWRKAGVYPDDIYPDNSPGLLITQTIQVTMYLAGLLFSIGLLGWTWRVRGAARP